MSVLAAFSLSGVISGLKGIGIRAHAGQIKSDAKFLLQLAENARSSGTLAVEQACNAEVDPFLRELLHLTAGSMDVNILRSTLAFKMRIKSEQIEEMERFWNFIVSAYSAWGMIGALTGLALAASNSEYAAKGFMIAMLSALQGVLASQCIALPILQRIKSKGRNYLRRIRMINEGLISVKAGETPRFMKERLNIYSGTDGGLFD